MKGGTHKQDAQGGHLFIMRVTHCFFSLDIIREAEGRTESSNYMGTEM